MKTLIQTFMDYHEPYGRENILSSGYQALDKLTGGLKQGDLFVIASRPSIGKTAFALNISLNMASDPQNPCSILFFSIESTYKQISKRLLCLDASVADTVFQKQTLSYDDIAKLSESAKRLSDAKIFIDDSGGISVNECQEKCRDFNKKHKIDVVIIDYLQLITCNSSSNRQQQLCEIMHGLKQLAYELNIPVILLVQLNRESGKKTVVPNMELFREVKAVEQNADVIILLHRELEEGHNNKAFFIVAKTPTGQEGVITMQYSPENSRFVLAADK